MTKAELLKLLEPFPDDTLIVVGMEYEGGGHVEEWDDLDSVTLVEIALNPYRETIGGRKYTQPNRWNQGDLDALPEPLGVMPAISFLPSSLERPYILSGPLA